MGRSHLKQRTRRDPAAGFTLVELLVTVAMLAVMAGLAVSYAGERRANLRGFAGQVVAECDSARLRSLSTRRWHRVTFDTDRRMLVMAQAPSTGMELPEDDADWTTIREIQIPKAVMLSSVATTVNVVAGEGIPDEGDGLDESLMFGPDGAGAPRTVYLASSDGRSKLRIVVYRATGSTYLKEGW